MNISELLKGFVVGSSLPVFYIFFTAVAEYDRQQIINYSYHRYTLLAPFYFGTMTVAALILAKYVGLQRALFAISIISSLFIMNLINYINAYNFKTDERLYSQYFKIAFSHVVTYNIIIYLLLKNICK